MNLGVSDPEGQTLAFSGVYKSDGLDANVQSSQSGPSEYRITFTARGVDDMLKLSALDGNPAPPAAGIAYVVVENTPPAKPVITTPSDGGDLSTGLIEWSNSVDTTPVPGSPTFYRCEVASDQAFTNIVFTKIKIVEQSDGSSDCTATGLSEGTYYARATAYDSADQLTPAVSDTVMFRFKPAVDPGDAGTGDDAGDSGVIDDLGADTPQNPDTLGSDGSGDAADQFTPAPDTAPGDVQTTTDTTTTPTDATGPTPDTTATPDDTATTQDSGGADAVAGDASSGSQNSSNTKSGGGCRAQSDGAPATPVSMLLLALLAMIT